MKIYTILFKAEFRRFWTAGMIIFAIGLIGFALIPIVAIVPSGFATNLSRLIESSDQILTFFTFLVFSAGIVGSDIKSGWVRTLLVRAITRQQYVITKIFVVFIDTYIVYISCIGISAIILHFNPKVTIVFDLSTTAIIVLLKSAHIFLLITLSTLVSCHVQNFRNSIIVYGWMVLAQMFDFLITRKYWDVKWANVLKDYIFPNGFEDAQKAILANNSFPYSELLWGCAALVFFFAATLFAMNKTVIDIGSE